MSSSRSYGKPISDDIIDRLYQDIFDNIKSSGFWDDIRVRLTGLVYNDEKIYNYIVDSVKSQCEKYCQRADLRRQRNHLRSELTEELESYYKYKGILDSQIKQILREQREEIKSSYYKNAGDYLRKKYIPDLNEVKNELKLSDELEHQQQQTEIDMDIESSSPSSNEGNVDNRNNKIVVDQDISAVVGNDFDDDCCDIEAPSYSPIGNSQPTEITKNNYEDSSGLIARTNGQESTTSDIDIGKPQIEKITTDSSTTTETNSNVKIIEQSSMKDVEAETSNAFNYTKDNTDQTLLSVTQASMEWFDEIPIPPEDDEFDMSQEVLKMKQQAEQLTHTEESSKDNNADFDNITFSSISSVATADLSDFDSSINLSDDEASIVGKPKNSKVSIKEIQGQINDLQTTTSVKSEPVQLQNDAMAMETGVSDANNESDGACSEGTATGRRVSRTRKQNSRYNNEHFIISK